MNELEHANAVFLAQYQTQRVLRRRLGSEQSINLFLAQTQEGRASLRQVEEARIVENDKWVAFYDAQYAMEKARWNVLRLTGDLVASIEALPGRTAP